MCKKKILPVVLFLNMVLTVPTYPLDKEPAPPKERMPIYKKFHRDAIGEIVKGDIDGPIQHFEQRLSSEPNDPETYFCLALAYACKKDINKAMLYVTGAVDRRLPLQRFIAGPRDMLKPLVESKEFKDYLKQFPPIQLQLVHGPMLGCVTGTSAKIWLRTADEISVQVLAHQASEPNNIIKSAPSQTKKENDFTAILTLEGLKPDTDYQYTLMLSGVGLSTKWPFRTASLKGEKCKFKIAFGGGAGYTPQHERMWNIVASHKPNALLLLGDNVYIDHPEQTEVQQYCYYRRKSRPEYQSLVGSTAVYAIYDDHDFGDNDCIGGPDIEKPEWKRRVWRTFKENWINPYYGGGETQPGCWFDFSIGDVDFFMLDGRYYRTDPQKPNPSMLGPVQKKWLFEKLAASKATFKVIASPVPFSIGTKPVAQVTRRGMVPGELDTWGGFIKERQEILEFLEKNKIDGVIMLAADRHRSDVRIIERDDNYPIYEFESSKLTNVHTHDLVPSALFGYNEKCSFGLFEFDTTAAEPQIKYEIINIDNETLYTISIKKSQLTCKSK
jgi:alkaline phosphatase D